MKKIIFSFLILFSLSSQAEVWTDCTSCSESERQSAAKAVTPNVSGERVVITDFNTGEIFTYETHMEIDENMGFPIKFMVPKPSTPEELEGMQQAKQYYDAVKNEPTLFVEAYDLGINWYSDAGYLASWGNRQNVAIQINNWYRDYRNGSLRMTAFGLKGLVIADSKLRPVVIDVKFPDDSIATFTLKKLSIIINKDGNPIGFKPDFELTNVVDYNNRPVPMTQADLEALNEYTGFYAQGRDAAFIRALRILGGKFDAGGPGGGAGTGGMMFCFR